MLKKKSLKTILIIFALITAIGVTSSLFGGSRPGKTSSGGSSSGSGSSSSGNSGSSEVDEHNYSAYNVCKDCGYSPAHTKITDKYSIPEDESYFYLTGSFDHYETCAFLVLLNQGTEREIGYYVIYNGDSEFESQFMNEETRLRIYEGGMSIVSGSSDYFYGDTDVTVYIADPTAKYVSFEGVYTGSYWDQFEITVDGKTVSEDSLVLPLNSKSGSVTIRALDPDDCLCVYEREMFGNGENEIFFFDSENVSVTYTPGFRFSRISIEA